MLLASCIRHRREELGLSIERAAQLSGMVVSEWYALEAGWVPDDESGLLRAIAGTLESGYLRPVVDRRDQPLQPGTVV